MILDGDNSAKVFVGGLAPATTNEGLKGFFSQYGAVSDAVIMMTRDKGTNLERSRGFGFVLFDSPSVIDTLIPPGSFSARVSIDGKDCDVKRIDTEKSSMEGRTELEQRKIFVGGLPEDCDSERLKTYFASVDPNLQDARVMVDHTTGRSRCFGYVTFSSPEFVQKAVAGRDSHYIGEKWIDVKPSVPRDGKAKGKDKGKGYYGGSYGKGYGGKGGYGGYDYGAAKGGYAPYGAHYNPSMPAAHHPGPAAYAGYGGGGYPGAAVPSIASYPVQDYSQGAPAAGAYAGYATHAAAQPAPGGAVAYPGYAAQQVPQAGYTAGYAAAPPTDPYGGYARHAPY